MKERFVRAVARDFNYTVDFAYYEKDNERLFVPKGPLVLEQSESGFISEPLFSVNRNDVGCLVRLMDDLWALGIRPTDAGTKTDIQEHLNDMRRLVFDHWLKPDGR